MTISTSQNIVTFYGNSVVTVFSVPFVMDSASDIFVIYTNSTGQQTTLQPSQYLVAVNSPTTGAIWGVGGTVTYPLSGSPIALGTSLTVQRILPLQQNTDLNDQGNFYAQVVEAALDTLEMQIQQTSSRTGLLRGTWATATTYNYGDIVVDGVNGNNTNNLYACALTNISGTWSTDLANGDWSLALNVQGIVNTLPQIANNQVFGNITGITATPTGVGVSALIDSAIGSTQGSLLYRSASAWVTLPPGTSGQFLKTLGASANPAWANAGGGTGTVTEIDTGIGLTGGPVTTSGALSLASIANLAIMANLSGISAPPGATTLSAILDAVLSSTQGAVLYRGATLWSALGPGSANQVLITGGASANPSWDGLSALIDTVVGSTQGDILYRGSSAWSVLAPGTNGQFLQTQGAAANPQWAATTTPLMTPLGVGSIIMAINTTTSTIAAGNTTDASNLVPLSFNFTSPYTTGTKTYSVNMSTDVITGTWKALQTAAGSGVPTGAAVLWQRTA